MSQNFSYVHKIKEITKGIVTQTLGSCKCPVAHLSKWLDPVVTGWPTCLRAVVATINLMKTTTTKYKLTLGQDLKLTVPHTVEALLWGTQECWLYNAYVNQCQVLLLGHFRLKLEKLSAFNPDTIFPDINSPMTVIRWKMKPGTWGWSSYFNWNTFSPSQASQSTQQNWSAWPRFRWEKKRSSSP